MAVRIVAIEEFEVSDCAEHWSARAALLIRLLATRQGTGATLGRLGSAWISMRQPAARVFTVLFRGLRSKVRTSLIEYIFSYSQSLHRAMTVRGAPFSLYSG